MSRRGPWRTLGIDPTDDRTAIRRAYAAKLKLLDVDREIEAYARLRAARDHALALAARLEQVGGEDERDEPWAGDVPEDLEQPSPLDDGEALGEIDVGETAPRDLTPPEIFLAILFPNGEQTDQPLDHDEWELAERALAAVIGEAQEATVDQHGVIEEWLAHHLASAWPRSAPLLEQAEAAFKWLDEAGQLSERPAIAFLNARLRGMRFYVKVQEPGHRLHKAWAELSKPGSRGAFGFLRAGKDDVRLLLAGIRERYPEVERHLDPERVGSWEMTFEESPWTAWKVVWRIIVVVWILSTILRLFSAPGSNADAPPVPAKAEWSAAQAIDLFGSPFSDRELRDGVPDLSRTLDSNVRYGAPSEGFAGESATLLQHLRVLTLLSAKDANFEELVAIKQLKLELLRVARDQGGSSDCVGYGRDGVFQNHLNVERSLRDQERAVAARLLLAGRLRPHPTTMPTEAPISGEVIGQIMQSTGLSEEVVARAARGEGDDSILCNYQIALLEAVLRRPGDVSEDLLRMI